jgi:hypothetical protein
MENGAGIRMFTEEKMVEADDGTVIYARDRKPVENSKRY